MSQTTQNRLNSKDIEKTIASRIKKEIAAANINTTTRKGNKELKFLVGQVAKYPLDSLEQAEMAGVNLGKHIAEVSQQRGKQNLDAGIIHQMRYQGELYSLAGLPEVKTQPEERVAKADATADGSTETTEVAVSEESPTSSPEEIEEPNSELQPSETTAASSTETPQVAVGEATTPSPAPEVDLSSETQPNDETVAAPEVDLASETQPNDETVAAPEVAEDSPETASAIDEDEVDTADTKDN